MHINLEAEFKMLLTTQQFFSSLNVGESRVLAELVNEFSMLEKTFLAKQEFNLTRQIVIGLLTKLRDQLELFDRHIPVANLRRHFEQVGDPNKETLEALLRFYIGKKIKRTRDRDKVDLIVTRWGKEPLSEEEKFLKQTPDLLNKLKNIYLELGLSLEIMSGENSAITALENEYMALLAIGSLRELIDRQVLLRIRKIKDEIEDLFFQPTILAKLVEINLALHNVFQKLLIAEQPRVVPKNELKLDETKKQTITSENTNRENKEQMDLINSLEEIGQSLSILTLQVQNLAEKLRNQNK